MEKNNKTLNVPHLRFPEFSGEWERCTIGDITRNFSLRNKDKIQYPMFSVTNSRGFVPQSEQFEDREMIGEDIKAYKIIHEGDFAYNPARINVGSIAKYDKSEPCMISSLYVCFKALPQINNEWLMQLLKTPKMNFYYNVNGEGGVRVYLFYPNFARIRTSYPSLAEQQKIAGFLSLLDQRIETQRKIIEDLKKLKDAICNMNFTSGSALKLGNVGKFVRGLTYSASDVIDDTMGTAVMRSNNISNGDPANFEELIWVNKTPNHEQILRGGDIIICMANGSSPLVGKASYYIDCGMESATVGAFCGIYRSYNPLTKWLFQSKHYKKHIQRCIQGGNGAIANIYPEDILAISFNIPSGYERVLNTLNSLEDKYLLEQKLLCRYLTVKSHLLAQLFI